MAKKITGQEYESWSKEELVKEIVKIKSTTYGLVWHRDVPEEKIDVLVNPDARTPSEMFPNEMAGKPFPVLKEVKSREIATDDSNLVNLLIEGDNYHSLAVLNFTHREAVDVIYIDPPYNTGNNDFIYNDTFVDKEDSFRHSKWLSFMEKRLKIAKNLLKKTGVIFISIDDNEQAPLRMLCDEVFGQDNFIATIIWQKKFSPQNDAKYFSDNHDYVLVYAKKRNYGSETDGWARNLLPRSEAMNARYANPDNDPRGVWTSGDVSVKTYSASTDYPIKTPSGRVVNPPKGYCWRFSESKFKELVKDNRIWFGEKGSNVPRFKRFLSEVQDGLVPLTIWTHSEVGHNQEAKQELKEMISGAERVFETPKPTRLIKRILELSTDKNSLVLDFMAGSGTTGHAVLDMNKLDGGKRRFILCTNNGDEKSKHKIASDICYPRIKKAISGYKNTAGEKVAGLGGNLRYYTTDFVEAEPTDRNKRKLVKESTDMLCIVENAFDLVKETPEFKIFKNAKRYLGVVFYEEAIDDYKKAIKKIDGHFNTYVFSMGDDPHSRMFSDMKGKVSLRAIPEVILKVYREIFK